MRCRAQWWAGLAAVALLAGCKPKQQAGAGASAVDSRALDAAEQSVRRGTPAGTKAQFRGVQLYAQALPQHVAVCGQVSPFADDGGIYVPFVAVVTLPPGQGGQPQVEQHIGTDPSEASRVYIALVTYCYDKGGPGTAPDQGVTPTPPLPDNIPDSAFKRVPPPPAAAAGAQPAVASTPASGSVTMRQAGNLHSGPHGSTLRVVPQGTVMHVFSQAPGGWYQVGDSAPWGWVHESMLDRH